ncbi:MAG: sulfite exporter TauE/SafE family protein [Acidimicrobiaceae bacterium]|nr:sulfite exporter TauE/SafE family protein [Acidimicrobiaceae bacterium]
MHIDLWQTLAGAIVGVMVGLTGMGGGALMTPMLILLFGINPGTAVSSDLLTSLVMRPIGGTVHVRRGTVSWPLVGWLAVGSVPAAFSGVLVLRALGNEAQVSHDVELAIGWALVLAAAALIAKAVVTGLRPSPGTSAGAARVVPRPVPTIGVGVAGGFMVGMTSVGSGSLMLVLLLVLYPTLTAKSLVGTDLVQAIPLIGAATLGHALYGHISLGLTGSLLIGSIPGVYLGARWSTRASDVVIRPALILVLLGTSLKLLGMSTGAVLWAVLAFALVGAAVWGAIVARARAAHHPDPQEHRRWMWAQALTAPIGIGAVVAGAYALRQHTPMEVETP